MNIRCPACGESFKLEDYLKDQALVQAIKMLPEFGQHGRLIFEYCELFRVGSPLKSRKLLRLLQEILEMWKARRFSYHKRTYEISQEGLLQAMHTVCNQQMRTPLSNHNYLKKVALGIAEEESKERSKEDERKFRERESVAKVGDRMEAVADIPGKVRELLDKIG